ncbi:MAG: hypothetical protein GX900_02430 [Clostridiaceae bacterium]|nr:hypothetical protein [Clostridiaceae bacterium]
MKFGDIKLKPEPRRSEDEADSSESTLEASTEEIRDEETTAKKRRAVAYSGRFTRRAVDGKKANKEADEEASFEPSLTAEEEEKARRQPPLSRRRALAIMELPPTANVYEVETRYPMLIRRYRALGQEEKLEEITLAYDILTNRWVPPPKIDPRLEKVVLGRKIKDWRNIIAYGFKPFLLTVAILSVVIAMIVTAVTNKQPDYSVATFGHLSALNHNAEQYPMELWLRTNFPTLENPAFSYNYASASDPQFKIAVDQKGMIATAIAGVADLLICDGEYYARYSRQLALHPMEDLYTDLVKAYPKTMAKYVEPLYVVIEEEDAEEAQLEPGKYLFGFNLSKEQLMNGLDIYGYEQVLCIPAISKRHDLTYEVIRELIAQAEEIHNQSKGMVRPTPTPTPQPMTN